MARRYVNNRQRKPLIVICSEGGKKSSEYYYFRNFANRNLRIEFSTGNSTDVKGMLNDLLKYIKNEDIKSEDNCHIFLVLDTDLNKDRINDIMSIEEECKKNNIIIITSAPTFEIMNIYNSIKEKTDDAIKIAQTYEKQCFNNNENLYKKNPHTSIYKIIEVINRYNNTQKY